MMVTPEQRVQVEAFRQRLEPAVTERLKGIACEHDDRDDGRTLTTRWAVQPRFWLELTIRPTLPQVRVGLLTDDRLRFRDLRGMIEASGYTLNEYVAMSFASEGLIWPDPPVEYYHESGRRFCMASALDLREPADLAQDVTREQSLQMAAGYLRLLEGRVE